MQCSGLPAGSRSQPCYREVLSVSECNVQENQQLRNDLAANERQLDRLQGYGLDALTSAELSDLVQCLTAAVERVRITTQLRHVQHLSTSRHVTGTSISSERSEAAEPSFRDSASGRSRLVSGTPHRQTARHGSLSSRGMLSGFLSQAGLDTQIRNGVVSRASGGASVTAANPALTSSPHSKRSLDMNRQLSFDDDLE